MVYGHITTVTSAPGRRVMHGGMASISDNACCHCVMCVYNCFHRSICLHHAAAHHVQSKLYRLLLHLSERILEPAVRWWSHRVHSMQAQSAYPEYYVHSFGGLQTTGNRCWQQNADMCCQGTQLRGPQCSSPLVADCGGVPWFLQEWRGN